MWVTHFPCQHDNLSCSEPILEMRNRNLEIKFEDGLCGTEDFEIIPKKQDFTLLNMVILMTF